MYQDFIIKKLLHVAMKHLQLYGKSMLAWLAESHDIMSLIVSHMTYIEDAVVFSLI